MKHAPHPLEHLFKRIPGGKASDFARALKVTPQAINQWEKVPVERAKQVEELTGVPKHELRPDIWEAPAEEAAG